ncbi:hypothetical protein DYBT9275_04293 [Dyadobacter sp. CECT 9275]|uniref:SCO family protein n=1 Tax=Dyadobacter helix TaxID=2822344 RepID=A0A916ND45_9BACT|nr:SCO family protein [Dyadobacter sp. CECT 9275]CAG5008528.1 hypothetical protein DYBT9275_04293 [Dyadobacter sp. CECT 9275]
MLRTVFLRNSLSLFIVGILGCSDNSETNSLPYYNTPDFSPLFFSDFREAQQKVNHRITSFSFTDQQGRQITDRDVEGKIHVANFIFTSCISICPVMTKHMKLVQQAFKNNHEVSILSFSVTPWIDNVGRLGAFARENGIVSPNWHLLTGSKGEIYNLARQSYFAEEDLGFTKDSTEFLHTEHIILVDRNKRIRGIYNGTLQLEIEQMIGDIRRLLAEDR